MKKVFDIIMLTLAAPLFMLIVVLISIDVWIEECEEMLRGNRPLTKDEWKNK